MPRTATSAVTSAIVGREIRNARLRAGMTQAQVAERLEASAPYVSGLEHGKGNMTIGQLAAIADAVGVELHVELRPAASMLIRPG
jgi:transcriptional regulator with XRE-family HTH domain